MAKGKSKNKDKKSGKLRDEAKIGGKYPGRNVSKKQTLSKQGPKTGEKPILKIKLRAVMEVLKTITTDGRQMIQSGRVIINGSRRLAVGST